MKKVKVAVVGVGYLGQFHAEKYAALNSAELVGVVDTDAVRGRQIAQKLNTAWFSEPETLFGKVDAVSIVVPTVAHYQTALPFLERGVHVLLEKPITATIEQADNLIAAAEKKKAILQIGHIERFNPAITSIKQAIVSPGYMSAERAAPFTVRCTDVNVVLDLMIHDLDIVADLAGSPAKELSAAGAAVITEEIDVASARIVFENGCIADITASRVSEEKKRFLRVFDKKVLYTCDYQTQKATIAKREGSSPELHVEEVAGERRDTLAEEIHVFIEAVRNGSQPQVSGSDGRRALTLARLITDTIMQGNPGFVRVC